MKDIRVGFVEVNPLFDDGLVVLVEGQSVFLEIARPLEIAGFDFEHVVAAVVILVDPLAGGIAGEGRLNDLGRARPSV